MENERTPEQRKMEIMERFVAVCKEDEVLGIARHTLEGLARLLGLECQVPVQDRENSGFTDLIRAQIAKTAILMDVLQIIYGDVSENEQNYLDSLGVIYEKGEGVDGNQR